MTQRLSPLDAGFLELEDSDPNVSLAIAAVAIIEGPPPSEADFLEAVAARLIAIPHARERIHTTAFDLSAPVWIDDDDFDVNRHLRRTALPAPGDDDALGHLVGRVMAQRLDRSRPLWECWVVEGLENGRWAILAKVHHCMADGIAGARLFEALCDPDTHNGVVRLVSRREPADNSTGIARRVRDALVALPSSPAAQFRYLVKGLLTPLQIALGTFGAAKGFAGIAGGVLVPTASTSLLGPVGKQRRYAVARASMLDIRDVCTVFDVKVNDVALAAITGALRTMLLRRGEEPKEDSVRTLVPVSVRNSGSADVLDNRVSLMLPVLPVAIADPVDQLAAVHGRMAAHKSGGEAEAGHLATSLAEHWPFAPTAWAVRLASRLPQHGIDIVATNVPGPKHSRTVLGSRVVEIFPYVPIAWRLRIGIAILSYADRVSFGITGDFDSAPDLDFLAHEIERHMELLVAEAHSRR
ncbi:wax ester/triacylglycerol synthase family O-acyltransferase [Antrihabitans sp. YC3-6]|uniref:Diacylglycerol O-acyltransferase n=1 Tax=Antrihabitans stalagmiti TaxID=2799499 RepID=A0A934NTL3_9NOCA|nr:wax ester/triacylglycerol synthase family O-acyltransferase [Antrihabitans stalagmiti]MBJ8341274.1 wax ester/triacylglycerol synthase family O-acyltransferase [Antrihabitans stalagmiti]